MLSDPAVVARLKPVVIGVAFGCGVYCCGRCQRRRAVACCRDGSGKIRLRPRTDSRTKGGFLQDCKRQEYILALWRNYVPSGPPAGVAAAWPAPVGVNRRGSRAGILEADRGPPAGIAGVAGRKAATVWGKRLNSIHARLIRMRVERGERHILICIRVQGIRFQGIRVPVLARRHASPTRIKDRSVDVRRINNVLRMVEGQKCGLRSSPVHRRFIPGSSQRSLIQSSLSEMNCARCCSTVSGGRRRSQPAAKAPKGQCLQSAEDLPPRAEQAGGRDCVCGGRRNSILVLQDDLCCTG